jgi:hypothetical protein
MNISLKNQNIKKNQFKLIRYVNIRLQIRFKEFKQSFQICQFHKKTNKKTENYKVRTILVILYMEDSLTKFLKM